MIGGLVRQLRHSRLLRNFGALGYGQVAQIASQLAAVPVFATIWGLETYGAWLLLFTIPSYLAISDLGLTTAATNDMIMTRARGDIDHLARTYQTLRRALAIVGLAVIALAALILFALVPRVVEFAQAASGGHAAIATLLLVGYGVFSLQINGVVGGLRASDRWAQAGIAYTTIFVVETIAAIVALLAGAGIAIVALCYFTVRAAALPLFMAWLRARSPELVRGPSRFCSGELRRLARPALAALSLPAGMALSLQATVAVIGAQAGVAAVPIFTTMRTLSRLGVQMTNMVSVAAMPVFGVARATGERVKQAALLILSTGTCVAVLIPAFAVLALFGRDIVLLWTGGVIRPDTGFVVAMAGVMVLNGTWMALSNILLSINRHEGFAYVYLALSVAALGLAWVLAGLLGPLGAALSLIFLDGMMLLRVGYELWRNRLFTRDDLRLAMDDLKRRLRALRPSD